MGILWWTGNGWNKAPYGMVEVSPSSHTWTIGQAAYREFRCHTIITRHEHSNTWPSYFYYDGDEKIEIQQVISDTRVSGGGVPAIVLELACGWKINGINVRDERNGEDMSRGDLRWKPSRVSRGPLGRELRDALIRHYGGMAKPRNLTDSDKPVLQGMMAAGVSEAKELISAIEKHGEISLILDR